MIRSRKIALSLISLAIVISILVALFYSPFIPLPKEGEELEISHMKYARLFSIEDKGDYYLITDGLNRTIILVKEGKTPPDIQADLTLELPVERIVALSTTHVAYLEALNATNKLIGVNSIKKWYFKDIEQMIENGTIKEVGKARNPNYEEILSLNPELVLVDGKFVGEEVIKKFNELEIPYISLDFWLEEHPLARLEWIKLFGVICGKEKEAINFFEKAEQRILNVEEKCRNLEKVDVVYALIFRGRILIPGGKSYHAKLVEIAGGNYLFKDLESERYVQVTVEDFLVRMESADVYVAIYMGSPVTREDLLSAIPELAETKPFKENRVYAMQPWVWQYAHKVDVFIEELASILHPEEFKLKELTMFKQI